MRKQDWIANQLRRVYDEALQEDIPADMTALLAQLDERRRRSTAEVDGTPGKESGSSRHYFEAHRDGASLTTLHSHQRRPASPRRNTGP